MPSIAGPGRNPRTTARSFSGRSVPRPSSSEDRSQWSKIAGAFTKGQPNTGQTLAVPTLPSQGIAIDDLTVTFVPDNDADGIVDAFDPDDDNDTMSDAEELVFGTDPLNAGSRFAVAFTRPTAASVRFSFPTATGRTYFIESSGDLSIWTDAATFTGNGTVRIADLPVNPQQGQRFYRIRAVKN